MSIISARELFADLSAYTIVDIRRSRTVTGVPVWQVERIPDAVHVDLDDDLSDRSDLSLGRHPLPTPIDFVTAIARAGVRPDRPIVVYDDLTGAIAARLWWMLRWIGGPPCRVLEGGFQVWKDCGLPVQAGPFPRPQQRGRIPLLVQAHHCISEGQIRDSEGLLLLDARAPERYRGEVEPLDPIAGHIPSARNAPWAENLVGHRFAQPGDLRARYQALGVDDPTAVVVYCGSGVTACHDLLAMELAGLSGARLYPGSWSEWCQTLDI